MFKRKRKILAKLFSNNIGATLFRQLIDGAPLRLDNITHSVIPTRGDLTPSMTRATTKTIVDSWGRQVTCLAGEVGFPGARRVYNYAIASETSSGWSLTRASAPTSGTPPTGYATAFKLTEDTSNNTHLIATNSRGPAVGATAVVQFVAKAAERSWLAFSDGSGLKYRFVNLSDGTTGTNVGTTDFVSESLGDGWYLFSWRYVVSGQNIQFYMASADNVSSYQGIASNGLYLTGIMVEDVTGQSVQTAGEYVSVGVESAPAYHGSCVDGVKCFPTDLSGNPLTGMTTPLIELAATNLCLQSQDFSTTWVPSATPSISTNSTAAPDGTVTADTISTDGGATRYITQGFVIANDSVARVASIYFAKTTGRTTFPGFGLVLSGGTPVRAEYLINTNDGATIARSIVSGTVAVYVESVGNYWRIHAAATNNSTGNTTATIEVFPDVGSAAAWVFTNAGSVIAWGAQLETGTRGTSYIATTTAAVTRNADQLYYTGALLGNIKTLASVDFKREAGFSNVADVIALSDGGVTEVVDIGFASSTAGYIRGIDGGATQWNMSPAAYTPGQLASYAQSFATNDIKGSANGVAQTADTSATIPTVTRLDYGMVAGSFQLNGYPGKIYGWTRQLSQAELNAVTA